MACNKTERRLLLPEPFRRALGHHDGAIVCGRNSATRRSHGTSQWSWMPYICSLRCDGTTQPSPVSLFPCVFYRLIFKDDTYLMRVRPTGILPANPRLKQALPFHVFPPSLRLLLRLAPAATCCLVHPTSHRISHWLGVKSSSSHSIFRRSRAIPRVTVLLGYPILSSGAPVKPEIPPDSISPSTQ